jgi:hypothetical protein
MEDNQHSLRSTGLQGVRVVNFYLSSLASPGSRILQNMCHDSAIGGPDFKQGSPGSNRHTEL